MPNFALHYTVNDSENKLRSNVIPLLNIHFRMEIESSRWMLINDHRELDRIETDAVLGFYWLFYIDYHGGIF